MNATAMFHFGIIFLANQSLFFISLLLCFILTDGKCISYPQQIEPMTILCQKVSNTILIKSGIHQYSKPFSSRPKNIRDGVSNFVGVYIIFPSQYFRKCYYYHLLEWEWLIQWPSAGYKPQHIQINLILDVTYSRGPSLTNGY